MSFCQHDLRGYASDRRDVEDSRHAHLCHPYMSAEQSRGWLHFFAPHGSGKRDVGSIGVPGGSGVKAGRRPPPEAARSGRDGASTALDWERREAAFGALHREVGHLANARRLDGHVCRPQHKRLDGSSDVLQIE